MIITMHLLGNLIECIRFETNAADFNALNLYLRDNLMRQTTTHLKFDLCNANITVQICSSEYG